MISFKDFLVEAFDSSQAITKLSDRATFDGDVYTFSINENKYFVYIQEDASGSGVTFGIGDPYELVSNISRYDAFEATGSNKDQFKILSTVINCLTRHFTQNPIGNKQSIHFSAKGKSRIRLYGTIAERLANRFNLSIRKINNSSMTVFIIGQK